MASEGIGAKQEKMIEQAAATMALESMPLSRDCYENLRAMSSGEKAREQITREITTKIKRGCWRMDSKSFRHRYSYGKVLIQLVTERQKER